jgi:hypothetical protein
MSRDLGSCNQQYKRTTTYSYLSYGGMSHSMIIANPILTAPVIKIKMEVVEGIVAAALGATLSATLEPVALEPAVAVH